MQAFAAFGISHNVASSFEPWDWIRDHDYKAISLDQKVLLIGGWLLGMLAVARIAVVVGAGCSVGRPPRRSRSARPSSSRL
jgi:hypothetical protein